MLTFTCANAAMLATAITERSVDTPNVCFPTASTLRRILTQFQDDCCKQALSLIELFVPSIFNHNSDPQSDRNPHKQATENADKEKWGLCSLCACYDGNSSDYGKSTNEEESNARRNSFCCGPHGGVILSPRQLLLTGVITHLATKRNVGEVDKKSRDENTGGAYYYSQIGRGIL